MINYCGGWLFLKDLQEICTSINFTPTYTKYKKLEILGVGTLERILAISDIHGQADALERLLVHANYHPSKDRLVLLGDYIGKGPNRRSTR